MSNIISRKSHLLLKLALSVKTEVGSKCSSLIMEELKKEKPSMIARFGAVEIKAILYPRLPGVFKNLVKHKIFKEMEINAGFFPSNERNIQKFSDLLIEDMKLLDILGSWRLEEYFLQKNYLSATRIQLTALEPYLQNDPWTQVLEDKKILVIHPFNKSIESQYYKNRTKLFKDNRILPQFKSFETIQAVQTIAGNTNGFNDWFDALDSMKVEIDKKEFDIAIIGCGAYGFPLAAHIKRIGKKAVHLGGPTQLLFGIKGKRWVESDGFKSIINDYFIYPEQNDKPMNSSNVEGGCYW